MEIIREGNKFYYHEVLINRDVIQTRVRELGQQISGDYEGKSPVLICVLKGAMIFYTDLIRELSPNVEAEMAFMEVSSYGKGADFFSQPHVDINLDTSIVGRNIIIVEDMVYSGKSLRLLLDTLLAKRPETVRTCVLLSKTNSRIENIPLDYVGFEIQDDWVAGYGLDRDEKYRNLKDIVVRKKS